MWIYYLTQRSEFHESFRGGNSFLSPPWVQKSDDIYLQDNQSYTSCYGVHGDLHGKGVQKSMGRITSCENKWVRYDWKIMGGKGNLMYGTESQTCSAKEQQEIIASLEFSIKAPWKFLAAPSILFGETHFQTTNCSPYPTTLLFPQSREHEKICTYLLDSILLLYGKTCKGIHVSKMLRIPNKGWLLVCAVWQVY